METLTHIINGFAVCLQPINLWYTFLGVFLGTIVGVLRRSDREDRIALLQCVDVDRGRLRDHFERRMCEPRPVVEQAAAEREAQERVRAPYAELPHDLL